MTRRKPHADTSWNRNHRRSRTSTIRLSASTSTRASKKTRRPHANAISIRRSLPFVASSRDELVAGAAGASAAIIAGTKPVSELRHQNPAPGATSPVASATDRDVAPSLTPAAVRTYSPERSALFLLPTNVVVGPSPPLQVD